MATLDDVARMAAELPEVTEGERFGNKTWLVGGKAFAWDRPFSKADIRRFGDQVPPEGPAVRALGHSPANPVYQARRPALRFSKGALAKLERGEREPSPAGRTRGVVRPAGSSETGEWGFPMDASVMFLDCPAYMDKTGSVRCGLPAEVQDRYLMNSTDGALESARIRCPRGHWFNGPIESLTVERRPALADDRSRYAGQPPLLP